MTRAQMIALQPETLSSVLERKRLFDTAWVVCWVSLLAAVAVPWGLNVLDINLADAALFVFVTGAGYFALAAVTDRLTSPLSVLTAMRAMPLISVLLIGVLWHLVGGLANPTFLLAFALPVIINGVVMVSRQAVLTAGLSSIVAVTVALVESNDLRWYVAGGRPAVWHALDTLANLFAVRVNVFPDVRTPPAYQFTMLVTFIIAQFLIAFLTTPLASILLRFDNRLRASQQMLTESQGLFHAVLSGEPDPGVILYGDTLQVVEASDSFFRHMLVKPSHLAGQTLFSLIKFDEPERVREALKADKGEIPFCVYRVGNEVRISNLSFYRTRHAGLPYLYVGWLDLTEFYYLFAAFDALDDPLLLVASGGQIHYSNHTARHLFGELHFGKKVGEVPSLQAVLESPGADTDHQRHFRTVVNGRPYDIHRKPATLPGAGGICTIYWFHCVEKEEALFEQATRDPLTGIYNRRFFDESLATQVERRGRGHMLALGYFDLDDFKKVNDQEGHAAGDEVLKAFVAAVRGELRESDVFARRGGDEFAVLFVDCDTSVAHAAIERVYKRTMEEGARFEGRQLPVKFSSGIAACQIGDSLEDLLERADQALYKSKRAGKNRCEVIG